MLGDDAMTRVMTVLNKAGVYLGAALLRFLLFTAFPRLPDLLTGRVEISTPITSFKRLQEGLFLYNHDVDPYNGGVFHHPPLLLPLFSLLPDVKAFPTFTALLYILVDLLSASALSAIADSGEAGHTRLYSSPRKAKRTSGVFIAAAYLFNPFTIATCLGRSTSVFTTCAVNLAIARSLAGSSLSAMIALAFASYLSMYPILLLPPLIILAYDRQCPKGAAAAKATAAATFTAKCVGVVGATLAVLLATSYVLAGYSWTYLARTYGIQLTLSDLTPNVGLWWYFFIEIFDPFRAFFLGVFWLHLGAYVGGLSIRLRKQPLAATSILLGIFAIFKPYPSIGDTVLFLGVLPLFRHVFPLMRYSFVAAATVLYATFLGPAFYHLWIYAGSGNANFFYAITLVWSLGQSLLVSDLAFAVLRDELDVDRPDLIDKDIKQM